MFQIVTISLVLQNLQDSFFIGFDSFLVIKCIPKICLKKILFLEVSFTYF